jgi:uncharacterized iron-regulated membrane protein
MPDQEIESALASAFFERAPAPRQSAQAIKASRKARLRPYFVWIHRWVGLIAGVYFVLAGLTGSVLAYWQDLDEWLNRDLMIVSEPSPKAPYRPIDEIVAAARTRMPEAVKARSDTPVFLRFPSHRAGVVQIAYMTGIPSKEEMDAARRTKYPLKMDMGSVAGNTIFVDPYTARVTGERFNGWLTRPLSMPFVYMVMSLHCALLWEPFGRLGIAGVGLLLLISTIAGIWLWWPRNGAWSKALRIRRTAKMERLVYDLHKSFGVYFGVVLIVSIFSGMYMNFKPPWRALVSYVSPVRQFKMELQSEPANGRAPLTPSAAAAIAEEVFPDGWLQMLVLPRGAEGTYAIGKHLDGEVNQATTSRMIVIDQYSGKVLATQDPREFSAGEKFFEWQYPLHSGEAFGNAGRAFMLAFGFVPLALYATGFIRWRHKTRRDTPRAPDRARGRSP